MLFFRQMVQSLHPVAINCILNPRLHFADNISQFHSIVGDFATLELVQLDVRFHLPFGGLGCVFRWKWVDGIGTMQISFHSPR